MPSWAAESAAFDLFGPADRDEIIKGLRAEGIGTNNYFPPIHLQPYIQQPFGYQPGDFPVTEKLAVAPARVVALTAGFPPARESCEVSPAQAPSMTAPAAIGTRVLANMGRANRPRAPGGTGRTPDDVRAVPDVARA